MTRRNKEAGGNGGRVATLTSPARFRQLRLPAPPQRQLLHHHGTLRRVRSPAARRPRWHLLTSLGHCLHDPSPLVFERLDQCAELLGVDLATIYELAANVEPYLHADATKAWGLMQLERQLRPEAFHQRRGGYIDRRRTPAVDS